MWITLILETIGKLLDFVNPWSKRWAEKATETDKRKIAAKQKLDDAAVKGDFDAFDDARADRDNPNP